MVALTPIRRNRQMVKRFIKTCCYGLTKLAGMSSPTDQNLKQTLAKGKSANSGTFVPDFGGRSTANSLAKESK